MGTARARRPFSRRPTACSPIDICTGNKGTTLNRSGEGGGGGGAQVNKFEQVCSGNMGSLNRKTDRHDRKNYILSLWVVIIGPKIERTVDTLNVIRLK